MINDNLYHSPINSTRDGIIYYIQYKLFIEFLEVQITKMDENGCYKATIQLKFILPWRCLESQLILSIVCVTDDDEDDVVFNGSILCLCETVFAFKLPVIEVLPLLKPIIPPLLANVLAFSNGSVKRGVVYISLQVNQNGHTNR